MSRIIGFILMAIVVISGAGTAFWAVVKTKNVVGGLKEQIGSQSLSFAPKLDPIHGRQFTISAKNGGNISIKDSQGMQVTLEIPAGALEKDTKLQVTPYLPNSSDTFSSGILVGPGDVRFLKPVVLTFGFTETEIRLAGAPKEADQKPRASGTAQILSVRSEKEAFPVLVARSVETATHISTLIFNGGSFLVSPEGKNRLELAKIALQKTDNRRIILESAITLAFAGEKLDKNERAKAEAAIRSVEKDTNALGIEVFSAAALEKKLEEKSFTFIETAYALSLPPGYFETRCKDRRLSIQEYLSAAATAELFGLSDIAEHCRVAANNLIADRARDVIRNPESSLSDILVALQNLQIMGIDDESNLDETLLQKAKDLVEKEAEETASDTSATQTELLLAVQRMQAIGVENEELEKKLIERVPEAPRGGGTPPQEPLPPTEPQEDLIPGFDEATFGLLLMEGLGIGPKTFDEQGIKNWTEEWMAKEDDFKMLGTAACDTIVALGGTPPPECSGIEAKLGGLFDQLEQAGNQAATEVGNIQDLDYQTPNYVGGDAPPDSGDGTDGTDPNDPNNDGVDSDGDGQDEDLPIEDPGDYQPPEDDLPLEGPDGPV